MTPDLKSCPFCGSNDLRIPKCFRFVNYEAIPMSVNVSCLQCGSNGPSVTYVEDIIEAWNMRV